MLSADGLGLTPFSGDAVMYQIHGNSGNQGQLSEIDVAANAFTDLGTNAGFSINGIGYRTTDNFIYGMEMSNDHLIRLGADGSYERLGEIDGLPAGSYYTGDFGHDGLLYVRHANTMYGINVDSVTVERTVEAAGVSGIADIAYNPETELYYSVRRQSGTTKTADFISVDLRDGADLGKVTVISSTFSPGGTYGAVFADANGRIFASNNAGGLYEVNIETGEATFAGETPRASSNDGAAPTNVAMNLPPVAEDRFVSTVQGATNVALNIEAPKDLEGDALTIAVADLPTLGSVQTADGRAVAVGDRLTKETLTTLIYDAPGRYDGDADPGDFNYTVTDGEHTVVGSVDILLSGESQIVGKVQVWDDSDYGAWEGYAFDNRITLTGYDQQGNVISQTTNTDLEGNFAFNGLLPGTYQLEQNQPEDVKDGFAETGELGRVRSSNQIGDIVIPTGAADRFEDFAFIEYAPSAVSGFVFVDENMDGEVDAVEVGVEGTKLTLTGTDDLGQTVSQETTTDRFGYYEFNDLRPGTYIVTQAQPDGLTSLNELVGSAGGIASTNTIQKIALGAGVEGQGYSFGEIEGSSISGSVYIDNDIDRAYDAEDTGVANSTIMLTGVDFHGNTVTQHDTTGSYGDYSFDNLLPGTYSVIQTEQPKGMNDSRDNVGTFVGLGYAIDRNGTAQNDAIVNIQLLQGEASIGNNFGERLDLELARRFDERIVLEATDGDDLIDIVFGEREHTITINGDVHTFAADRVLDIYLDALAGHDTITMTGTDGVEEVRMWSDSTRFHSESWRINVDHTEDVHVEGGGGYDLAYLYGTKGDENVKSTEAYLRMEGDGFMNKASHFHRAKAYSGGGADDRAYFYDSKKDDTIKMTDKDARMFNRKFYNVALDFDRVYAFADNGGTDHARFWDSARGKDQFDAQKGFARMYNQGRFYNAAWGFEIMVGSAVNGGANDRVNYRGSEGDDTFVASPRESGMTGDGYEIRTEKFERTYAFATEGNNRAYLYDSKSNDRLIAQPDNVRLYNARYYISARYFDQVDAYSSNGGSDRAYFYDSTGDDTFIALENEARMSGDGFNNLSHGFSRQYVHAKAGGNDSAYLFDTDRADTVKLSATNTRMYGPGYYTRLISQFENTEVEFTDINARDRAIVFGVLDSTTVESMGGLSTIMTEHGASFIYDADGLLELSSEDEEDDDGSVFASLFPQDELYQIPSAT